MIQFDAIIIGGGHNALVAACYLSQKLCNVLVLEQRHILGGACQTEELYPGFKFSRFSYLLSLMRPAVLNELKLFERGLKLHRRPISSITVTKNPGEYLLMNADLEFNKKEIAKFSQKDAATYGEYNEFLSEVIDMWSYYQDTYPVDPQRFQWSDMKQYTHILKDVVKKREKILDYIAFMGKSSSQFLDEWFESEILKGTLITDGIIGEMVSIDTPASAYVLLHHVMGELFGDSKGEWAFVEGGMGSISRILEKILLNQGAHLRTNSSVEEILLDGNQVRGIRVNGEELLSPLVISSTTPRITFQNLLKGHKLPNEKYNRSIKSIEYNGACTKFNFAVSELPRFKCFEGSEHKPESVLQGTVHIGCESLSSLRQAYQDTVNGAQFSKNLFVDLVVPSVHDKTISPQGQHVVQCLVQYTPYNKDINKAALQEHVIDYISQYAPNFKKSVLFTDMLTPVDLQTTLNMTEGNIFHGSLTLDRLFSNRPANGYNSYGTPIKGLYLCGAGTHPGGGVMGAPGRNCANYILNS